MAYLVAYYGVWLSLALVIGMLTAFACRPEPAAGDVSLLRPKDFVFAVWGLLFVALVQVSLGRLALYFESALLFFLAFVVGVGLIVASFGKISRDRIGWRLGAASVALVWVLANLDSARSLERDLRHSLGSLVARAGGDALFFEVSGRDVFLPVDMPDRFALADRIHRAAGVRVVWQTDALSPRASELRDRAIASAAARRAAYTLAEIDWARRAGEGRATAVGADQSVARRAADDHDDYDKTQKTAKDKIARDKIAEGRSANRSESVSVETPARLAPAAPIIWRAPIDPTLPAPSLAENMRAAEIPPEAAEPVKGDVSCRTALLEAAGSEKIRFEVASASVRSSAGPVLDKIAALLKRCPDVTLELGGHADSQGSTAENRALSLRRAQSVADYLGRSGVERRRLTSVGYGVERPLSSGDTPEGRAENRRVEFAVK